MIFDKLEIIYEKPYIPLKIKYSETRKPTFMEFLILLILLDHPEKNKSLKEILKENFNIQNLSLFERAFRDLINYKILDINKSKVSLGILNMNVPIDNYIVDEKIKKDFSNNIYAISNENKYQEVKYYYDSILNEIKILKERDWEKRVKGVKISHKLNLKINLNNLEDKDNLKFLVQKFIKDQYDLFGDNCFLKDIELEEYHSIEKINSIKEYIQYDSAAINAQIEIFDNGSFKIKSEDKNFENFLRKNSDLNKDILVDICEQYEKKLRNKFRPEEIINKIENYDSIPDLISNINIKSNWNLLLVNDQHIESDNEFLKNKDLVKNIEIIIFYNSKRNNKTLDYLEGKIVAYLGYISDEILLSNSFIYLDSQNYMNGFLVALKNIDIVNKKIPVVYSYKNLKSNLNLVNIFKSNIKVLLEMYNQSLVNGNYKIAIQIFTVLERIGLEEKISNILYEYLLKDIDSGENFKNLKKYLVEIENKKALIILERMTKNALITISKNRTDDEIFKIINCYNFTNSNNLLKIFNKIEINESFENIFKINRYLKLIKIDGWRNNVRDSLIKLTEYFKKNNRAELFNVNEFNSDVWILHASTLNKIGNLTKELYSQNYNYVENNYEDYLISIIDLIKTNVEINEYDKYLLNISDALIDFYRTYYKYKTKTLNVEAKDIISYKIILMAMRYLSELEEKVNDLIDKKYLNMPIEVKLEWIKHIENKRDEINKIIKNNDNGYKIALNIIFGKKQIYDEESIDYYLKIFGGK